LFFRAWGSYLENLLMIKTKNFEAGDLDVGRINARISCFKKIYSDENMSRSKGGKEMDQDKKQYEKYLEMQEKEREKIVNNIIGRINIQSDALRFIDAKEILSHIDSNRLIAQDFGLTKELFRILVNELERVIKRGEVFEAYERELKKKLKEKENKLQAKLEDSQKRLRNIFHESEEGIE